jgi:inosine-uridine nucleoside N-ribohydrolase
MDELTRISRLDTRISMVLDTDTYNEVDDQFAVVYALRSRQRLSVEALYAAPFWNDRSNGPEQGMERSYDEIGRLLERLEPEAQVPVHRGSRRYMDKEGVEESDAVTDLIRRARADRGGAPLYVVAIGAPTNVANAIRVAPDIIDRIVVVWLGGQPHDWPTAREFNLMQDLVASRILLDSGVPLVQIPCKNVAEHVRTTLAELREFVASQGAIGQYLYEIVAGYTKDPFAWSKVIWDVTAVAWLLQPGWLPSVLTHSPILTSEMTWSHDPNRHLMRVALDAHRDAIFADLFRKLQQAM